MLWIPLLLQIRILTQEGSHNQSVLRKVHQKVEIFVHPSAQTFSKTIIKFWHIVTFIGTQQTNTTQSSEEDTPSSPETFDTDSQKKWDVIPSHFSRLFFKNSRLDTTTSSSLFSHFAFSFYCIWTPIWYCNSDIIIHFIQ